MEREKLVRVEITEFMEVRRPGERPY